jgi:hypothetical protein
LILLSDPLNAFYGFIDFLRGLRPAPFERGSRGGGEWHGSLSRSVFTVI